MIKITKENPLQILSIGTQILVKDVMDQFLRSLGEVKTFYASKLPVALKTFRENRPQIIFCEQFFTEGGAIDFIQSIGGLSLDTDLYFVVAAETNSEALMAMAVEQGIDELLIKPFSIENIEQIVGRYLAKQEGQRSAWCKDLRAARNAEASKRFQESERLCSELLVKYKNDLNMVLACGELSLLRGKNELALDCAERGMKANANNARAMVLAARASKNLGKFREALVLLNRAANISPLNYQWMAEIADLYILMADEQVNAASRMATENGRLILRKARILFIRKEHASVVQLLENKRAYLSDEQRREADNLTAASKKIVGLK